MFCNVLISQTIRVAPSRNMQLIERVSIIFQWTYWLQDAIGSAPDHDSARTRGVRRCR